MIRLAISNQQAVHLSWALMEWLDTETENEFVRITGINDSILAVKQDLETELGDLHPKELG